MSITINMVVSGDIGGDPLGTFTGPIVSFTSKKAKPIVEIDGEITAQQDLHGYSKPWAGGSGKNICGSPLEQGNFSSYGMNTPGANRLRTVDYIPVVEGSTVTVSYTAPASITKFALSGYTVDDYSTSRIQSTSWLNNGSSITLDAGVKFIRLNWSKSTYDAAPSDVTALQVEYGSTVTAYEPYSNICPITGLTEANIFQEAAYDAGATAKRTVSFGQTVYGGNYTIDENGGVTLELTDAEIASYAGEPLPSTWISDRDEYAVGTTPTTGAQVVYKLASPTTTTLSSIATLNTLVGTNEMWADTGDITVKAHGKAIQINTLQSLNMLLGNAYVNNHTPEDVSDEEALDIIMGESR